MDFIEELHSLSKQISFEPTIQGVGDHSSIVISGMGGSGIAGKIFSELYSKRPVYTLDDYMIPEFVNSSTLFIAMSYSGNTEEIIAATEEAKRRGARVVALSSGGKLSEMVDEFIRIPGGLQPRSSLGYMLVPLLRSFINPDEKVMKRTQELLASMDSDNQHIKEDAAELSDGQYIPIIYGFRPYNTVAYRWKTQFNENSKVMAFSSYFPELDHNEIIPLGPTYRKEVFRFYTFDTDMPERLRKRIDETERIGKVQFRRIKAEGESTIEKLFYLIHYGDYLTYYLGLLRGTDPRDVTAIEELKKSLA